MFFKHCERKYQITRRLVRLVRTRAVALVAALARTRPSRVPEWLYARQCSTASIAFFTAEANFARSSSSSATGLARTSPPAWPESVRRDAKQRHLGGRRPGTHRPRDGRRLRGYPRGRSRPHPRRGRVPVPAERGGERGRVRPPPPSPSPSPRPSPGWVRRARSFPAPRRRLRRTPSPPPRAPSRAVRIPREGPRGAFGAGFLALFLDDAHPVRLHLLRGLVRLGSVGVGAGEGALAGERARGGGSLGVRGKGSRR